MSDSNRFLFTEAEGVIAPRDLELAAAVFHKLESEYPGHAWFAHADHAQGVVAIKLMYSDVTGKQMRYGYILHVDQIKGDPGLRAVVRAGGELLERFGLPRHLRANDETKLRAIEHGLDLSPA